MSTGVSEREALCEFVGHEWGDAGGGLEVCVVCETERWAPDATQDRRQDEAVKALEWHRDHRDDLRKDAEEDGSR